MGLCLLHLRLLLLRVSGVLCPLVLSVEGSRFFFRELFFRTSLLGLLCPVCMNCRKLYRMVL